MENLKNDSTGTANGFDDTGYPIVKFKDCVATIKEQKIFSSMIPVSDPLDTTSCFNLRSHVWLRKSLEPEDEMWIDTPLVGALQVTEDLNKSIQRVRE